MRCAGNTWRPLFLVSSFLTISIGAGLFLSSDNRLIGQVTPSPFHIFLFAPGPPDYPQEPTSTNIISLSTNTSFALTTLQPDAPPLYFYVPSAHWSDGTVPLENGMRLSIRGSDGRDIPFNEGDWSNGWQVNTAALKASPPSPPCSETYPCLEAIASLSGVGNTPGTYEIRVTADDGTSQAIGIVTWTVLPEGLDSSTSSKEVIPSQSSSFSSSLQPEQGSSSQVNLLPPFLSSPPPSSSSSSEASVGVPPPPPLSSPSSSSAPSSPLLPPWEGNSSSTLYLQPPFHPSPPPPPSPLVSSPSFVPPPPPSSSSSSSKRPESSSRSSPSSISSPSSSSSSKTPSTTPSSLSSPLPSFSSPSPPPPLPPSPLHSSLCCMSLVDGTTFFVRHQPSLLGKLWANAKEILEMFLDLFYDAKLNNPCGADAVEVEETLCIAGDNDGQQGGAQQPFCGDAIMTRPEEDCDPAAFNFFDRLCFANNPNLANPDNAPPFWLCPSIANPEGGEACKCDRAPSLSSSTASSASSCGGFTPDAAACRNGACPPGQRCTLIPAHTDPLYSDFDECGCAPSVSPPPSIPPRRPLPPKLPQKKIPQFCCGKAPTWTTCGGPRSIGNSSSWMAGVPEHERRYYYSCFDICNVLFGPGTLFSSFCRRNLVYDNLAECNRVCFQASIDENARVCRKSSISNMGQRSPVMCSFSVGGGEDGAWSSSSAPGGESLWSVSSPSPPTLSSTRPTLGSSQWALSSPREDIFIYLPASSVGETGSSASSGGSEADSDGEWPGSSGGGGDDGWDDRGVLSSAPANSSAASFAPSLSSRPSSVSHSFRSSFAMSSVPFTSSVPFSSSSVPSRSPLSLPSSVSSVFSLSSFSPHPLSSVSSRSASSGPSADSSDSLTSSAVLIPFVPPPSSVSFLPPMEVIRQLPPGQIAHVIAQLPPREAAELLAQFPVQQQQEILQAMTPERRRSLLARSTPPACGNGRMEEGEQCEPALHSPDSPLLCLRCRLVSQLCGDGKIDPGEECDDGIGNTMMPNTRCRPDCGYARCGDGVLDSLLEQCDDGNYLPGDGCDGSCHSDVPTLPSLPFAFLPSTQLPASPFPDQDSPRLPRRLPRQTTETGPELLAIMAAGAAGGWAWMRRRRTTPSPHHIAR